MLADARHGLLDARAVLFRGELLEAGFRRQLDIDGEAVSIAPSLLDQQRVGIGDGFQVNITAEIVVFAQAPGDAQHLFHRVIRITDDAGGQEQALNVVALVEIEGELDHLIRRKTRAPHIAGRAVDAIKALIDAEIGEQNFQQRNAAPVRRIGVADAGAFRRSHAASAE